MVSKLFAQVLNQAKKECMGGCPVPRPWSILAAKGPFMKTGNGKDENTNFEAWARLLIERKVPSQFQNLIDPEVVDRGAEILKRGEAFEVRVCDHRILASPGEGLSAESYGEHILIHASSKQPSLGKVLDFGVFKSPGTNHADTASVSHFPFSQPQTPSCWSLNPWLSQLGSRPRSLSICNLFRRAD